ncbi:BON domain-containing protein [Burkholderia orbicola]|uniref:BON domain-containing protein n=2 Tax=Burkholderia cepacia complex TaxID=87882 RepID=A0A3R9D230_9BURK|nr:MULTISPECIES: BON domain-containing protein [Burkholderia cepacia complex]MDN7525786.1 BON domain-containing protein [Burkholderia orbicola]MDN7775446.1 BON domain-containing protein [Burkholderia orbicola]MDN7991382.1 BON domain-containing protein [Burkholderia orbicola]RSC02440.1 BON domain-containing protein [Burkholderia cenocepacia]
MKRIGVAGWLTMVLASAALAQAGNIDGPDAPDARRNWYNDPFVALSQDVAECPLPLGPWMTRAEMTDDAHYRAERGTTCWLAHRCTKPNSYMYDASIADAAKAHFAGSDHLRGTSLWITVQRRFIYVEGCADTTLDRQALQREFEALPDVEQVFVRITDDPRKRLPYKARGQPDRTPD